MRKDVSAAEDVIHTFCVVSGKVNADLLHRFHDERIEGARLESRAVGLEGLRADAVEERLRHLAAGAVMNANEEDFFHDDVCVEHSRGREMHNSSVVQVEARGVFVRELLR